MHNIRQSTSKSGKQKMTVKQNWTEVLNYKDSSREQCFEDLASQMNHVKYKLRNRMNQKTLRSILCIHYGLRGLGHCCKDFVPSQMLQRFSVGMYRDGEEIREMMDGAVEEGDYLLL